MPTYDYACRLCGHGFEHFQGINDKRLRKCPQCGERSLDRLIGAGSGILFKGSGFYETDYKQAGRKPSASSEDGAASSKGDDKKDTGTPKKEPGGKSGGSGPEDGGKSGSD